MKAVLARLACCALVLGLLPAAAGCGSRVQQRGVTVMVPWSDGEFQAFYSVVKTFEGETGIRVDVQVTRALTQQLDAAVAADAPPDLAMLPSVGAIREYVKDQRLRPLDVDIGAYVEPFRDLATEGGEVYAVPVKADVKSLIWYNPAATAEPPGVALPDLLAISRENPRAWCVGLASGPTSGWPGADWIADIVLAQGGVEVYQNWLAGRLQWTAPQVQAAWRTWRSLVGGSLDGASTLPFDKAAAGMFGGAAKEKHGDSRRPGCSLGHGALSAMHFSAEEKPLSDYAYVTSSPERRLEVSADFVGMFTNNPSAAALITYLSGRKAQQAWGNNVPLGYAISANGQVTRYGNEVQQRIAKLLQSKRGYTLCFGAADAMRPDVSAAFYRAVLDYATSGENLPKLLKGLDKIQRDRGSSPVPSSKLCATH